MPINKQYRLYAMPTFLFIGHLIPYVFNGVLFSIGKDVFLLKSACIYFASYNP